MPLRDSRLGHGSACKTSLPACNLPGIWPGRCDTLRAPGLTILLSHPLTKADLLDLSLRGPMTGGPWPLGRAFSLFSRISWVSGLEGHTVRLSNTAREPLLRSGTFLLFFTRQPFCLSGGGNFAFAGIFEGLLSGPVYADNKTGSLGCSILLESGHQPP